MYIKRKYPRFSVSGVAEIRLTEKDLQISGMIEKISRGGIGVYTRHKLVKGVPVKIEITLFTGPDTSHYGMTGVVQTFQNLADSGILGMEFDGIINMEDQPELMTYLNQLERQYSKYKAVL